MTGIKAIGVYIPERRIENRNRMTDFSVDTTFLQEKIGIRTLSRRGEGEDTADLCEKAYRALLAETDLEGVEIDCLVVCSQNPDGRGLPHTSALLHGRLEMPGECACWDISLGCTGFVQGLTLVQAFMEAQGLDNALFFTADPYSKIIDPDDRNTAMLFGDGAAVTWISRAGPGERLFRAVDARFHTDGTRSGALENRDGFLRMEGRAVLNYSIKVAGQQIDELLEAHGLDRSAVPLYLFHQGSKYIVDLLRRRLEIEEGRAPLRLEEHGNLVSSTIPVMLKDHLGNESLERIMLSSFGVGLSAATCLLERGE